jgi:1,2-dihydroxy-3-keto-5-methylthiopentene dioxygenase
MARITVPGENLQFTDHAAISKYLDQFGIWYECWDVAGRIRGDATNEEILLAYKPEVDRLKQKGGYVTADVINVTPETPGLDAMLEKFNKEHTHSQDEVRFIVAGRGVFYIHPPEAPVFAIEMQAGDLINVPAGTQHWFDLCQEKTIRAIRLFVDDSGWAPYYLEQGVHSQYESVCFGPTYVSAANYLETK